MILYITVATSTLHQLVPPLFPVVTVSLTERKRGREGKRLFPLCALFEVIDGAFSEDIYGECDGKSNCLFATIHF